MSGFPIPFLSHCAVWRRKYLIPAVLTACLCLPVAAGAQEADWEQVTPESPATVEERPEADEPEAEDDGGYLVTMEPTLTGAGGPAFKFTGVADQSGLLIGGRGGLLIDRRLLVGGAAYGLVSSIEPRNGDVDDNRSVGMGYGGMLVEFTLAPDRLFNVTLGSIIGAGSLNYVELVGETEEHTSQSFFLLEPEIHVGVYLAPFLRFSLGLSYRWATGLETGGAVTNRDARDFSLGAQFQFGDF